MDSNDIISKSKLLKDLENMRPRLTDAMPVACFIAIVNMQKSVDAVVPIRCKQCEWFGKSGCAISIVDDSDKPNGEDFCSFAEPIKSKDVLNEQ